MLRVIGMLGNLEAGDLAWSTEEFMGILGAVAVKETGDITRSERNTWGSIGTPVAIGILGNLEVGYTSCRNVFVSI